MTIKQPFPHIWIGGDLGDSRLCESTYCRLDYGTLPPLPTDRFDNSFGWLLRQPSPLVYDERFATCWDPGEIAWWSESWQRVQPAFEAFIWRTWIENEIWFRLVQHDQPLTAEMTRYLDHYRS